MRKSALKRVRPVMFLPVRNAAEKGIWLLFREPIALDVEVLFGGDRKHNYLVDLRRLEVSGDEDPESLRGFNTFADLLQKRLTNDLTALDLADLELENIRRAASPASLP